MYSNSRGVTLLLSRHNTNHRANGKATAHSNQAFDFCWHCRSLVLTCSQRMYNTVGGNAPLVGVSIAPYGSLGAAGVCGVLCSPGVFLPVSGVPGCLLPHVA